MEHQFIIAGVISIIFLIVKFGEMRFIEKESKPLKLLFRDTLIVYLSVLAGFFVMEQLNPVIEGTMAPTQPTVFTDNPAF
jgi:hypothetical protein